MTSCQTYLTCTIKMDKVRNTGYLGCSNDIPYIATFKFLSQNFFFLFLLIPAFSYENEFSFSKT